MASYTIGWKDKNTIHGLEELIYQIQNRSCKSFLFRTRRLQSYVFLHSFPQNHCFLYLPSYPLQPTVSTSARQLDSTTLEEIGKNVEQVALASRAFIRLALWLCAGLCLTLPVTTTPPDAVCLNLPAPLCMPSRDRAARPPTPPPILSPLFNF